MPQIGFVCCDGEKRRFADCIQHALACQCPWTPAVLEAMAANIRPEQPCLTVTELLGCARQTVLKKQLDWYETPASAYAKFRGSMFHKAIEGSNGGAIVEERFAITLPSGVTISGQPDLIYPDQHLLLDFKTTRYIPKEPYAHHILQLNAYRYLVWGTYEIWNLEVAYFDMSSCRRLPVPLMDMGKVESFLVQQGSAVTEGLTGSQLPERTGEDGLWQCGYCPFTTDCWPQGAPKKVRATAKA
jgi:hypothetical protein